MWLGKLLSDRWWASLAGKWLVTAWWLKLILGSYSIRREPTPESCLSLTHLHTQLNGPKHTSAILYFVFMGSSFLIIDGDKIKASTLKNVVDGLYPAVSNTQPRWLLVSETGSWPSICYVLKDCPQASLYVPSAENIGMDHHPWQYWIISICTSLVYAIAFVFNKW